MANKMKFQNQLCRQLCWAEMSQKKYNKYERRFLYLSFEKNGKETTKQMQNERPSLRAISF